MTENGGAVEQIYPLPVGGRCRPVPFVIVRFKLTDFEGHSRVNPIFHLLKASTLPFINIIFKSVRRQVKTVLAQVRQRLSEARIPGLYIKLPERID